MVKEKRKKNREAGFERPLQRGDVNLRNEDASSHEKNRDFIIFTYFELLVKEKSILVPVPFITQCKIVLKKKKKKSRSSKN